MPKMLNDMRYFMQSVFSMPMFRDERPTPIPATKGDRSDQILKANGLNPAVVKDSELKRKLVEEASNMGTRGILAKKEEQAKKAEQKPKVKDIIHAEQIVAEHRKTSSSISASSANPANPADPTTMPGKLPLSLAVDGDKALGEPVQDSRTSQSIGHNTVHASRPGETEDAWAQAVPFDFSATGTRPKVGNATAKTESFALEPLEDLTVEQRKKFSLAAQKAQSVTDTSGSAATPGTAGKKVRISRKSSRTKPVVAPVSNYVKENEQYGSLFSMMTSSATIDPKLQELFGVPSTPYSPPAPSKQEEPVPSTNLLRRSIRASQLAEQPVLPHSLLGKSIGPTLDTVYEKSAENLPDLAPTTEQRRTSAAPGLHGTENVTLEGKAGQTGSLPKAGLVFGQTSPFDSAPAQHFPMRELVAPNFAARLPLASSQDEKKWAGELMAASGNSPQNLLSMISGECRTLETGQAGARREVNAGHLALQALVNHSEEFRAFLGIAESLPDAAPGLGEFAAAPLVLARVATLNIAPRHAKAALERFGALPQALADGDRHSQALEQAVADGMFVLVRHIHKLQPRLKVLASKIVEDNIFLISVTESTRIIESSTELLKNLSSPSRSRLRAEIAHEGRAGVAPEPYLGFATRKMTAATQWIIKEAERRGIEITNDDSAGAPGTRMIAQRAGFRQVFDGTRIGASSSDAMTPYDKLKFLEQQGFQVLEVHPLRGMDADGSSTAPASSSITLEKILPGRELQVVVVGGKVTKALYRQPKQLAKAPVRITLIGDGTSSVSKLLHRHNAHIDKGEGGVNAGDRFPTDALRKYGALHNDVLKLGQTIELKADMSHRSSFSAATADLTRQERNNAERIAEALGNPFVQLNFKAVKDGEELTVLKSVPDDVNLLQFQVRPLISKFVDMLHPLAA